ncbi:response regulator transcription factor [Bacillus cereus group sp. MYBK59-1]|uniref:DNA-binding response regulator n=1 Tax=Bacillus thuringiensis subsp. jegathesan TaxID=56955 RepID=A0A9X6LZ03_BACTJ|nr:MULTISPECIES: response regulator transcription factor [Bacillus cereus group]TKV46114.1 DNA-binding response regulator [Bacillus sp. PIC28]MCB5895573.1 response regulator transcription factor [Bacillus cereus]MCH5459178.1 response regulator transcription factor [Bacillus cereus]MCU5642538.1 response regulator transcription factor [Bacillus cereus]MDA2242871.1 response regulator transcription factor [Bacillus cereus]
MSKILVLEDELTIRSFIVLNLKRVGFYVIEATTGEEALQILSEQTVDIALLDVMLPGIDGLEVCKAIRKENEKMGIIMLTARVQDEDKVQGLGIGADDYIAKPFSPVVLTARIQSLLRRIEVHEEKTNIVTSGPFSLNIIEERLYKDGQLVDLTPTEYMILQYLMNQASKPVSRDEILNMIWGTNYVGETKVVDVNMRRLRQKIECNPSEPEFILTVWGKGYVWKESIR